MHICVDEINNIFGKTDIKPIHSLTHQFNIINDVHFEAK